MTGAAISPAEPNVVPFFSSLAAGGTGGTVTAEANSDERRGSTIQFRLEWQLSPVVPPVTPVALLVVRAASELKRADSGDVRWV